MDQDLAKDVEKIQGAFPPVWSHPKYRGVHFLTEAEIKVLKLVAQGKTNDEIGGTLFIQTVTVRDHVKSIYSKCGIKGRSRLAIAAHHALQKGVDHD